ncbi:unnamed protein product [Dibothriocephalus latus]|uniref:Uncharacterized protein n=1 Tax=Dibothriocephalus latus TaxID=60516 RepID=A0A3P7LRB6_DIBLA|nr:unnamed protein product [Dibothriocephalus latus]
MNELSKVVSNIAPCSLDVVLQRRYWAAFEQHNSTFDKTSVIELPTEGRPGFFLMSATGFSFSENLRVNTSWTEDKQTKSRLTQDTHLGSMQQFPDVEELQNWTLKAYRLSPPIMYPDSAGGHAVTYEWFLPVADSSLSPRRVVDKFWIIDVDKEPVDKLRAWIVSKSVDHLELYVYFQHSNSSGVFVETSEAEVELLKFGCLPDDVPQILAKFTLKSECSF